MRMAVLLPLRPDWLVPSFIVLGNNCRTANATRGNSLQVSPLFQTWALPHTRHFDLHLLSWCSFHSFSYSRHPRCYTARTAVVLDRSTSFGAAIMRQRTASPLRSFGVLPVFCVKYTAPTMRYSQSNALVGSAPSRAPVCHGAAKCPTTSPYSLLSLCWNAERSTVLIES